MRQAIRFVAVLVVGLAVCSVLAHVLLSRMMRGWFEADLITRAELVHQSARPLLGAPLRGTRAQVSERLAELARAERVLGAQVCTPLGATLGRTEGFPASHSCRALARTLRAQAPAHHADQEARHETLLEPGGRVFLSMLPLPPDNGQARTLVLLQDMSYVDRREQKAQRAVWIAFTILALAASLVTQLAVRISYRTWTRAIKRMVQGNEPSPELKPLVGEVRELVQRLSSEWEQDARGGHWSPERLRGVLNELLHGERILVVSNREPYIHERDSQGAVHLRHPASGLVTALEPVVRACSGVWIAHGAGSADREMVEGAPPRRGGGAGGAGGGGRRSRGGGG
jgi:trehalose 6-phosphate synthase